MQKRVTFVELTIYERVLPLVSGYLQAYACQEPDIQKGCHFERYSTTVKTPAPSIVKRLLAADSDIYAISCYVWNMALVKRVLRDLRAHKPEAHILLGGPQVMNHAPRYLNPDESRTYVCNGEGERTFRDFLKEMLESAPGLERVRGLSYYRDRELVTTPEQDRIRDLNEVPSPFLSGLLNDSYSTSIFETNRGCPYKCGFCYWGAATNDRVAKFDEARVVDELTWLSRKGLVCLYLADANWGMLERDLGFSEHIASCARSNGSPRVVYYSAAKNRPDRLTAVTEIFTVAGIISTQPVSMQTLNPTSLEKVDRKNIKLTSYMELQNKLREKKISSFTELIWPLPGETVESFNAGLERLCAANSGTVIAYPHLLLHNTALSRKADDLGLVRQYLDDEIAEVELIVGTADVNLEQFRQGLRLFYSMHILYNMRCLTTLGRYLHRTGKMSFGDLFSAFAGFCRTHREYPIAEFCEASIERNASYDIFNYGTVVHLALHAERASLDQLLSRFVSSQAWWDDQGARMRFEIDLLNRPYVYSNTPTTPIQYQFAYVEVVDVRPGKYVVRMPDAMSRMLRDSDEPEVPATGTDVMVEIDHNRRQYPFMSAQGLDHNAGYCHGMILRVEDILAVWSAEDVRSEPVVA